MSQSCPLISIIVPVYKVEPYLEKCVDSILVQTYSHLEIILVDDGSPDGCGAICDRYAAQDPRIRVIHKPNGGISDARNAGLDIATGEYIGFVDSDDYTAPTMYEQLLKSLISAQADIAVCQCVVVKEGEDAVFSQTCNKEVFASGTGSYAMIYDRAFTVVPWNKLYRRELFAGIRYPVGLIYEDLATTYLLTDRANTVVNLDGKLYAYVQHSGSIMNQTGFHMKQDKIQIVRQMWQHYSTQESPYKLQLQVGIVQYFLNDLFKMLGAGNLKENKQYAAGIAAFLKENRIAIFQNPYIGLYHKTILRLFLLCPRGLQALFSLKK